MSTPEKKLERKGTSNSENLVKKFALAGNDDGQGGIESPNLRQISSDQKILSENTEHKKNMEEEYYSESVEYTESENSIENRPQFVDYFENEPEDSFYDDFLVRQSKKKRKNIITQ